MNFLSNTKKVDYNHLKVILIEREFLEKEETMAEMIALFLSFAMIKKYKNKYGY